MRDTIHIACSADERFIHDCGVMLHSLFANNPGERFDVHFLHDSKLPAAQLAALAFVVTAGDAQWSPLRVSEAEARHFPLTERFGLNAWYRVLLPKLLPEFPRVLYLDSDLLIVDRLRPLWQLDLVGHSLAAVTQPIPDSMLPRIRDTLGLPSRGAYFNSGVMLLDLNRLRACDAVQEVIEFISDHHAPMPWADQDPLNAVLHHSRMSLHPRWNLMTPMFETPDDLPPFTVNELRSATSDPAVIHFIGEYKPLHYRCRHPYRARYFKHLAQTPWRDREIYGRTLKHMLLRPLPWVLQHRAESALARLRAHIGRWLELLRG